NLRRLLFQSRNVIGEPAAAFNHDYRPVPPDTLQQLVFGNGTAIDQNREHRNIERSSKLEKRFRLAAPLVAIYEHEMRMIRIQRRAVVAGDRRTAGVSHFPGWSDTEQTALSSAIHNALSHNLHDACLRTAVDDECFGIRSRASNTATEQLGQPGGQLFVQLIRSSDD